MATWEFKLKDHNANNSWLRSTLASNSVAILDGTPITAGTSWATITAAWESIMWVAVQKKTFDSDNITVAKEGILYNPEPNSDNLYELEGTGQTILFDADLVTSNTIDMDVNGVAMTQVTYGTSSTATCAAIASQLVTDFASVIASTTAGSGARTIKVVPIESNSSVVITNITVAAGSSQASATLTADTFAEVDEGSYYDLTSVGHKVRISSESATSGQVQLVEYVSASIGKFRIANT